MSISHSASLLVHAIRGAAFRPAGVVGAAVHGVSDHPGALLMKKSACMQATVCRAYKLLPVCAAEC
jgi:hypothetical protein